jgi:hypothetical protein
MDQNEEKKAAMAHIRKERETDRNTHQNPLTATNCGKLIPF